MENSITPPGKFDFRQPESWTRWLRRFDRYLEASGLSNKSEERQVSALIYAMGDEADEILHTFGLSDANRKKYKTVAEKFSSHFITKRNIVFERAKFNRRIQEPGEPVDTFITSLYTLVEHCDYGALRDELIRDRIVVGIQDKSLSEKMQTTDDLTLTKAITMARQKECVKKQQVLLHSEATDKVVTASASADAIKKTRPGRFQRHKSPKVPTYPPKTTSKSSECHRCGLSPHPRDKCPARDAECGRCKKTGHYAKKCRNAKPEHSTRHVKAVLAEDQEGDLPYAFLGSTTANGEDKDFHRKITLNKTTLEMKVDTGADVTVVDEADYGKITNAPLKRPDVKLVAANQLPFKKVLGMVECNVQFNDKHSQQTIYVVDHMPVPLLGKPAIKALGIVAMVGGVDTSFRDKVIQRYPKLFTGLGELEEEYNIELEQDAQPYAISSPRRIALPLLPKVKEALEQMVDQGVIRQLDPNEPSKWCAGMVVVPKPNGSVRICVDLSELNKSVVRPRYMLPTVDYTLAQLKGAKIFTKLDANAGFHQVKLAERSQLLTSFLTPFGRFCFTRLPFGISSGPEYFTDRMTKILLGTKAHCQMDDVLVASSDVQEHEAMLFPVLDKLQDAGVTLNPDKCAFMKEEVTFVGHTLSEKGIRAEQRKVSAIVDMEIPTNIHELRRFLGMANQMAKFSPNLTEITQPLRDLLSKKNVFYWGPDQETAFRLVKAELSSPRVLAIYDPSRETKISADASSYGLGAVLLQKHDQQWKPVYYASRSMTPTERRYAQVEKEALASTWACDKFADYLVGLDFTIETDHRPLVALLEKKSLDDIPPRIMRFRLRLLRYRYRVVHIPGKEMYTADTLSRAPLKGLGNDAHLRSLQQDTEAFVYGLLTNLPATSTRLDQIREAQFNDPVCQQMKRVCFIWLA
jgi:predicted aspartyl protease